jgi:hypothetical protein
MISRVLKPLLLTVLAAGLSAGQVTTTENVVFLRATIETYPETERRPILDYLDGARVVADRVIEHFAAGRDLELDGEFAPLARARSQKIFVREYANMVRQTYGPVKSYEFKCQALEAPAENPDVHDVQRARSTVYYLIRTAKRPNGELFLTVKTTRLGNLHAASFLSLDNYNGKAEPCLQGKPAGRKEGRP